MGTGNRTACRNPCERYFPLRKWTCGKPGRYIIYETRNVCKECYQAWRAGMQLLFLPGRAPTAAESWAFWERLRADVPASCRRP